MSHCKFLLDILPLILSIADFNNDNEFCLDAFKYIIHNVFNDTRCTDLHKESDKDRILAQNDAKFIFYENLHNVIIILNFYLDFALYHSRCSK